MSLNLTVQLQRRSAFLVLWLAICLFCSNGAELKATRVEKGPQLDGVLSDDVWKLAVPFSDFKMVEPRQNSEPTEKTELKVLYDEWDLYLGVYCHDREPSKISANSMAHDDQGDEDSASSDLIRILIDPFQDKRNAYIFFVNPRGARSEGLAFGEHFSLNWDGIWEAKAKILSDGWSVEIKIPFKTISFKPGLKDWGLNLERYIPRKLEKIRLSGTSRDNFFYNAMEAAPLEGIQDVRQGIGVTFRPYGALNVYRNSVGQSRFDREVTGGFDIYKNFTPNFIGALSYKTDFAETEVDERRINLTRFSLYFPEKRTFFLEGSEIFNFGIGIGESFIPFFSRRIGLYEGRQIPLVFGTKFFGKLGNTNMAILGVRNQASQDLPAGTSVAARVYQNIFSQSKVGMIFTNGSPAGVKNSLFGLDLTYSTNKFRSDKNFAVGGWWVHNWNEARKGSHQGFGFMVDYPNDLIDARVIYNYFGDSLNPGLGFLPRNNVQYLSWGGSYKPRPQGGLFGGLVRQFFFELEGTFYWDLGFNLETREVRLVPFNLQTESGEHLEFNLSTTRDVLPYDFEIAGGIVLPKAAYDFTNCQVEMSTASFRPVVWNGEYRFGQFYSGHIRDLEAGVTLKYKGYATLAFNSNFVRGDLAQGKFSENVYQIKADFFISPDLGLMNYVQYDDVSRLLGVSLRLRWRISPGNEIYFVYNKDWERRWNPLSRFNPLEEHGVFKIQLSIRP